MSKKIKIKVPLRVVGIFVLSLLLLGLVAPVIAPTLLKIDSYIQIPHAQASPGGMEQVIFGGDNSDLHATDTRYDSLFGGWGWRPTESDVHKIVSTDGVFKYLRLKVFDSDGNPASPGAGKHWDFTVMLNGALTALTVEIADAATSGNDMVHEVDVTGGDTVSLQCDPDNSPANFLQAAWTTVFESDAVKESLIAGGSYDPLNNAATEYGQVMCCFVYFSANENAKREVVPTSGTIKDLYLKFTEDPGTGLDAYRFTLRKNGISTDLTVTITADDTTGSDLVNTVGVVAGDILTLMIEPLNTPAIESMSTTWGMTFVADIDGESIVMGGENGIVQNSLITYNLLVSYGSRGWAAFEEWRYQLGQECTVKKLHILLSGSPGDGNKYDFIIRAGLADTNVIVTISGAETTGNSGGLTDTIADSDIMTLKAEPDSYPTERKAYWGFVCYTGPPFTVTQTFVSCETTTFTTDTTTQVLVTEWTVVQVIIDPITTVTVTSSTYTAHATSTASETDTETETGTSTTTTMTTTSLSSTVTLLTFCVTSTIPTSCTTSMITSTQSSTTTTCSLVTWTETTTWVSTSVGA